AHPPARHTGGRVSRPGRHLRRDLHRQPADEPRATRRHRQRLSPRAPTAGRMPRRGRDARADAADGDAHREPGRRPSRLRGARAAEPANESHLAPAVDDRAAARGRPPLRVRAGHAQPALVRRGQRSGAKHAAMSSTDLAHAARDAARWHSAWRDDEAWLGRVLLAPAVLYIVALVGFPFLLAIVYSMSDVTVGTTALDFVGLRNFRRVLDDPT